MIVCDKCHLVLDTDGSTFEVGVFSQINSAPVGDKFVIVQLCDVCAPKLADEVAALAESYKVKFRLADKQKGR